MKKLFVASLFTLIICCFCASSVWAQESIEGYWEGSAGQPDAALRVNAVFQSVAGALRGTISIPDSGIFEWPLASVSYEAAKLHFEIKADWGKITAEGALQNDSLAGAAKVGSDSIPFLLKRVATPAKPYKQEEVRFQNGDVRLSGTLLLPEGKGPHPALLFVGGSGAQTRDSERFLADHFARHGIATLIYDKRGAGASTGNWRAASFDDLTTDVLAGVALLKNRPEIAAVRIGLMGRSEGSWLVSLAAARSPEIAFIIPESGGGVPAWQQHLYSEEAGLRKAGVSDEQIKDALALTQLSVDAARTGQRWDKFESAQAQAREQKWLPLLQAGLPRNHWFWNYLSLFINYDPAPTLEKLTCPLLVILGEKDESTPARATAERMEQLLKKSGQRDYTIKVFPEADHSLNVFANGFPILAPDYLDTLTNWVTAHAGKATVSSATAPAGTTSLTVAEANKLIEQKHYQEAKSALETIIKLEPKNAEAKARLGFIQNYHVIDYEAAVANLEKAIELDQTQARYYYWLGEAYGNKADKSSFVTSKLSATAKAKKAFEQAIALAPDYLDARLSLLQFYLQVPTVAGGSVAKAKEQAEAILKLDPAQGYLALARIHEQEKDLSGAEASYRKLLALDPARARGYNQLGNFYLRQKRTDEAMAQFKKAVEAEPDNFNGYYLLGEGYFEKGETEAALTNLRKAIELNPKAIAPFFTLAQCYEKRGERKQALEAYQRYLESAPPNRKAEEAKKRVRELQGK